MNRQTVFSPSSSAALIKDKIDIITVKMKELAIFLNTIRNRVKTFVKK
ncbi:hypothetical protein [Bacillus sp. V5-8f]|nr:hypothetical protein [Bacillus sp. V5-8f]